jgi:deoxyxylulose-5-phosphate synthase
MKKTSVMKQIEEVAKDLGRFGIETKIVEGQQYFLNTLDGQPITPCFNTTAIALGLEEELKKGEFPKKTHAFLTQGGFQPNKSELN